MLNIVQVTDKAFTSQVIAVALLAGGMLQVHEADRKSVV